MKLYFWLIGLLALGLRAVTRDAPRLPEIVRFNEHQGAKRRWGKVIAGGQTITDTVIGLVRGVVGLLTPRRCAFFALTLLMLGSLSAADADLNILAANVALLLTPEEAAKKKEHDKVAGEAYEIQEKWKGKPMPQNVGEDYAAKCKEAERLWAEIEPALQKANDRIKAELGISTRRNRIALLDAEGKRIPDPTMPEGDQKKKDGKIAGYIGLSDYVVAQKVFHDALAGQFRASVQLSEIPVGLAYNSVKGRRGQNGEPLIALTKTQREAVESVLDAAMERKALVTIGAGVIEPERLSVEVQVLADARLRLRDVIPVGQISGSSVSYIREESYTSAAAPTTPGSAKPEAALVYTEQTATVRTIAAWIPVTTDQLADWPSLKSRIDNRLLYDVRRAESEQVVYGNGTPPNLEGLLDVVGTSDIAAHSLYVGANDRMEHIRLGIAIVAVEGYEANAMIIHPFDWFSIITLKGTDDHYLGQVFMVADRQPRVWGLDVVEDVAMEASVGVATEERNLLIGDFRRGCEILDRMQANVMIGLNSDDFTKNRRTLLAEERIAFPIYAPAAFAFLQTQVSAT